MNPVEILPFDQDLGYPQQQQVLINDIAYTTYYRWNPEDDGFAVLKIVRTVDDAIVLNSRIEPVTPLPARDPVTCIDQFQIFPNIVSSSKCEVWVFYD